MGNIKGNDVKEALVSQGTRTDARGGCSRDELTRALNDLEDERAALQARKGQLQARLVTIRNSIRGRHLPNGDYRTLCDEQSKLVQEAHSLDTKMADANVRLVRLRRDLDHHEKPDGNRAMISLLSRILDELKILNARLAPTQQTEPIITTQE